MDPDANLKESLELANCILNRVDDSDVATLEDANDGNRLAELFIALDAWITKGGFAPSRWKTL